MVTIRAGFSALVAMILACGCTQNTDSEDPTQTASDNLASACGALQRGESLAQGQSVTSCDGRFVLVMQGDGNLVLYFGSKALWSSGTGGSAGKYASMQTDGNFVLYDSNGTALWNSGTGGHPYDSLAVQNDGNVVIYGRGGKALWSTGTGGAGQGGGGGGGGGGGNTTPAQCVDTLDFFLPDENGLALDYPMTQIFTGGKDGGTKYNVKWGADAYEYYTWNKDMIYLNFDSSNGSGANPYTFSPGPWIPRSWCVGQSMPVMTTIISWTRTSPTTWSCVPNMLQPPTSTAYTMEFRSHGPVDVGGDVGVEDAIVIRYNRMGGWEDFTFGTKHGWIKWLQNDGQQAVMNRITNKAIQPASSMNCRP